jgi:DNA primase
MLKVCSFPDGDDQIVLLKKNHLSLVRKKTLKIFIRFKASLLMKEAKNDPIKKAG